MSYINFLNFLCPAKKLEKNHNGIYTTLRFVLLKLIIMKKKKFIEKMKSLFLALIAIMVILQFFVGWKSAFWWTLAVMLLACVIWLVRYTFKRDQAKGVFLVYTICALSLLELYLIMALHGAM